MVVATASTDWVCKWSHGFPVRQYAAASLNYAVATGFTGEGDVPEAFEQAFAMFAKLDGIETPVFAGGVADFGRYLVRQKQFHDGVEKLREALERMERLGDKGAIDVRRDLADALLQDGQTEEAVKTCVSLLGNVADNIARGRVLLIMGRANEALGRIDEAVKNIREAVMVLNKHDPNEPQWLTRQKAQVHLDAAEEYLKKLEGRL